MTSTLGLIPTDELLHVDMTVKERNIKFDLTFDPQFVQDINAKWCMQTYGACEPEVMHVMRRVIRAGDFVIDGGASTGFMTLTMSRLVGEQGHVEAFEPATVNFNKLRRNLELNRVENVSVINRALWSDEANLTLHIAQDTGLCSLMPFVDSITTFPVKTLTLDRWCENYDQRPRLIKLDVEGAEEHALIGASQMLERGVDFIVTEINARALYNFGSSQHDLRHYMRAKGYLMFMLHEDGTEPLLVPDDQMLTGPENMNVLWSKPDIVRFAWEAPLS